MKKTLLELAKQIEAYLKPVDRHLEHHEHVKSFPVLVLAVIVASADSWIIYCVETGGTGLWFGLLGHVALVAILAFYALLLFRRYADCRFEAALCLAVLAAGPIGAFGIIVGVAVYICSKKTYATFDEFFESLSPSQFKTRSQTIYENILSGRDDAIEQYSVIPFLDILSFGTELQKRQALAKMTKNYQPDFAPVFRKALNDKSNMIRVQAATAITRIESQFLKHMNKLAVHEGLKNVDPQMLLAIAEHYDNYAYTGLLDPENELMNRSKALELYKQYLSLVPDNQEIYVKIGRIMMRNGDYVQACYWLREYIEKQSKQGSVSNAVADWYSESLYAAGKYDELRRFRTQSPSVKERTDIHVVSLREALQLWEGTHYAAG